ncbi:MAG: hypothetical protein H0V17_19130 [Deltaproteobacteria bacterium]|nr:hypothetical protein [Deltaproteobacteria bacterium]
MIGQRPLIAIALAGCASSAVPGVRFANAPPVQLVDDRRDVPKEPSKRKVPLILYHLDGSFLRVITRGLEVPRERRALGVNAFDEVPDSTWFTNRIGVREMTPAELVTGPAKIGNPEPHKPWTVIGGKTIGKAVGFTIKDARGEKFQLKIEAVNQIERETTAGWITNQLMWAVGYHVPEEYIAYFRADELVIAPGTVTKDLYGGKVPLDRAVLDRKLKQGETDSQGRYRASLSRLLEGKPIGGHPAEGTREDDPNDKIAHDRRRDLRGYYTVSSWLDSVDIKEDNSLDMWVKDPQDSTRHYVKHYQLDFGKSLGFMTRSRSDLRSGYEYYIDYGSMFLSLITLGLADRKWEHRSNPALRGVGVYDAKYDPAAWKPNTPAYVPFHTADRFDKLWASKILIRFTREQLRAVVEAARLTDPRAVDFLVDTLVKRQRVTAAYWFARASPLDRFSVAGSTVCFDDLALDFQLFSRSATRYAVTTYDGRGHQVGAKVELRPSGRTCTGPLAITETGDGYTMVRIEALRPEGSTGIIVHLARDPATKAPRVIGLWRE